MSAVLMTSMRRVASPARCRMPVEKSVRHDLGRQQSAHASLEILASRNR